ncbi:MAG: transglutaminase domain-containing protein, partial [Bacteroidales bacterium]|nr:transglutaminase domain-containing protein [Bacteroidales bacterium]
AWQFRPELDLALKNSSDTALNKAILIYNYIRDNYQWNNIYNIYTTDDLSKIAKNKTGNSADISMMLIYLLKKAGLDAFPALIKTVDKGYVDVDWASAKQFNNVIACVEIDNKKYFFDAKNKNIPWYILAENNLNYLCRVIKNQDSEFINVKPNKKSVKNYFLDLTMQNNNANCVFKMYDLGYFAYDKRKDDDKWINNFTTKLGNTANLSTEVANLSQPDEPLISTLNFTINDFVQNNEFYPFDLFQIDLLFYSSSRIIPVYFTYEQQMNYKIHVKLPSNKEIISMPQNKNLFTNGLSFLALVSTNYDYIEIDLQINIDKSYFNSVDYNDLRNFFLELDNYINTPIVLY